MIKLQDGVTVQRHGNHVRKRENLIVDQDSDTMVFLPELCTEETTQSNKVLTSQKDSWLGSQESEMPSVSQENDSGSTVRYST